MAKPKCYFAGHLGFSEVTRGWYHDLLDRSSEYVDPIDPFAFAGNHHIPSILAEENPDIKRQKWNNMAKDLFRLVAESDMMVAIIDGEPPDTGMANETGFAYALHHTNTKTIPIIGYRNDVRSGGDGELGYNAMFLPAIIETGGIEVRGSISDLVSAIGKTAANIKKS